MGASGVPISFGSPSGGLSATNLGPEEDDEDEVVLVSDEGGEVDIVPLAGKDVVRLSGPTRLNVVFGLSAAAAAAAD